MANPKIQVDITGDASKLKKAAKEAEKSVKDIDDSVGDLGKGKGAKGIDKLGDAARGLAEERLGPLGEAAELAGVGLDTMSTSTMVAGAAIVGLGTMAAGGIKHLQDMHGEVRKFNDASGAGWETSSRLVAVMDDVGVSADTGAGAMGRLAKNIDAGKLEDFGIKAVYAKDGTVDLGATLGVVADAMIATNDPTRRAALGTDLFGKSWADLMPLLRMGSSGINDAMADVQAYQIATEESNAAIREYEIALDGLQDAFKGLQGALGAEFIPALTEAAQQGAKFIDVINKTKSAVESADGRLASVADGLGKFKDVLNLGLGPLMKYNRFVLEKVGLMEDDEQATSDAGGATEDFGDAAEDAADAERELNDKIKEATKSINDQVRAYEAQQQAVLASFNKDLAYERQQRQTKESVDALAKAQEERDRIVGDGTPVTEAQTEAVKGYEEALLNAKNEALQEAASAAEVAKSHAEATKQTDPATAATLAYRDSLVAMREKAADPALRDYLNGLIAQLDAVRASGYGAHDGLYAAGTAWSDLVDLTRQKALDSGAANIIAGMGAVPTGQARMAEGGPVAPGKTYLVGEEGPELFRSNTAGEIVPNDQLGSMTAQRTAVRTAAAATTGPVTYNIEIRTGADPEAVVAAIERYRRRNGGLPW